MKKNTCFGSNTLQCDVNTNLVLLLDTEQINLNYLKNNHGPLFLNRVFILLCTRGEISVQLDYGTYKCSAGQMGIFADTIVLRIPELSDDFEGKIIVYSHDFLKKNIQIKSIPFLNLLHNPIINVSDDVITIINDHYNLISHTLKIKNINNLDLIIKQLVEINFNIIVQLLDFGIKTPTSAEFHTDRYLQLLFKYVRQHHFIDFYAAELNLSKKYLLSCVKEVTGHTAFEIGDLVLLVYAKEQLLNSGLSMKEISNYLGFTTQSTFSTWFKRLTDMRPSDFRKIKLPYSDNIDSERS